MWEGKEADKELLIVTLTCYYFKQGKEIQNGCRQSDKTVRDVTYGEM